MDKVRLLIEGDEYWIEGGDFEDMVDALKRIPGRRFDPEEKAWTIPGTARQVAEVVRPYALMHVDDDWLADTRPIRIEL